MQEGYKEKFVEALKRKRITAIACLVFFHDSQSIFPTVANCHEVLFLVTEQLSVLVQEMLLLYDII